LFLKVSQTPIVHTCVRKVSLTLGESIQTQKVEKYSCTLSLTSASDGTSFLYFGCLVFSGSKAAEVLAHNPSNTEVKERVELTSTVPPSGPSGSVDCTLPLLDELGGQRHALSFLSPGNSPGTCLTVGLVGARANLHKFEISNPV
jgi:hypothetical protein